MRYSKINPSLFIKNRKKLLKKIDPNSLIIVNSNDEMPRNGDQNFLFRQNSDMFYLTGLDQEKCILCLCPDHPVESLREVAFTALASESMVIWYGHKYSLKDVTDISGIKSVKWLSEFESTLKDMMSRVDNVYISLNENPKYSTDVPYRELRFVTKLKQDFPIHNYKRLAPVLTELRAIKEPEEIALLQTACNITEKAFRRVLKFVKPGIAEYEVEAEMTHEFLRNGSAGHSYAPIIASGKDTCILHYVNNDKICKNGDLLLLDFGAEYANYAGDLSRTIPVNGKFTKRQKECYNAVLRVLKKAKNLLVPGNTIDKVNAAVEKLLEKEMIGLGLFTRADVNKQPKDKPLFFKYFMHGNSHFIGLDVHDVGNKQVVFKKGMVLSCEPGLYIQEENIGIRIENDIVVADKPIDLMKNIPIEAGDIEMLMAGKK
ncbi:MAG: aminopeptidase P N-terminal domain-containing protein [Bacteroidia bacterium]|nr:aminopeptidase P N-terminal domain-containing protein [Bacteroidia bacterium]